jgi:hypothetical protein
MKARVMLRAVSPHKIAISLLILTSTIAALTMPDSLWRRIAPRVFAAGNTYTVINTNDSGPGSLRQAILDANANPGADTIAFNIPGSGVHTIFPQTTLPAITEAVVIDGYSQPGAKSNTKVVGTDAVLLIELDGSQDSTQFGDGLDLSAGNCTVRGLVINSFPQFGINIAFGNPGQNTIAGNYIGTDPTGMQKKGNTSSAVMVNQSWSNRIGGTTPADRNVLSGNGLNSAFGHGVEIDGNSTTLAQNSLIQGNYIGINAAGDAAIPNFGAGILLDYVGTTTVGGSTPSSRNVISGNTGEGIYSINAASNSIIGNYIGIDATGTKAVPNTGSGVRSLASINSFIGSSNQGEGNLISGNAGQGIWFESTNAGSSDGNRIFNNLIGTAADGTSPLPNGGSGIYMENGANNSIGLINQGAGHPGNTIAFNPAGGIFLKTGAGTQNSIRGNSIDSNGFLGIALSQLNPLPNDAGDTDVGPNNLQNYPVLSNTSQVGNQTSFNVALNSKPNASYSIDYYISPTCNPSGFGEGKIQVNSGTVNTDASGNYSGTATILNLQPGQAITATATDISGNTSEFSQCLVVPAANGPGSLQLSAATYSVSEGGGIVPITITRTGGTKGTVTIIFQTSGGTATIGTDYVATSGDLTFNDGVSSQTFNIAIKDNLRDDPDKTINVSISNPGGGATLGTPNTAVVTILDDDPPPTLSINDVSVNEGNSGTTNAVFTVTLSAASGKDISVNYATSDGVASAGSDYVATSGTLNIPAGSTSGTITVPINGDTAIEPDETFFVNLSGAVNATVAKAKGTGTIVNDDTAAGSLQFSSAAYSVNENGGAATITVTRTGGSAGTVTVDYSTPEGTADSVGDYTAVTGTLTFANGVTQQSFTIPIVDDALNEANETVNLSLANPTGGATLGSPKNAVLTILDNDPAPSLSVSDSSVTEGNSGTTNMAFTVSLSAASGKTVAVDYTTADGSATAGSDYQGVSGTLTFLPGETSKLVNVAVNGDTQQEQNETFSLNLSNPSNATLANANGTGTILDDDSASTSVQFSAANYDVKEDLTAVVVTVTRSGSTSIASTVDYATANATANQLADYELAGGTLSFAPGDTSKTFLVLINQDSYLEGDEQITLSLSNPTGASLGTQSTATITIKDDAVEPATNPIDVSQNFVYQQYHDVLDREPDTSGLQYWTNELQKCGTDATCLSRHRYEVAADFFIEQEFKQTNYFVYRFHKSAFGIQPSYLQFMHDRSMLMAGNNLDSTKLSFADNFVARPEFLQKYPASLTGDQFVTALLATVQQSTGVDLSTQKQALIADYQANGSRARVLRQVADAPALVQNQYNAAFVLGQYFDYLRREPDQQGYDFWLDLLDHKVSNNLSGYQYLVCSFVTSPEYQKRFGSISTHSDTECAPILTSPNNDVAPSLSVSDISVKEGDSGTTNAAFTVVLSAASEHTVTVDFATADVTTTAGADYQDVSGTLTFAPGEITKVVNVLINGDTQQEPNETFILKLSSPSNATIAKADGIGTIIDDDSPATAIQFSSANYDVKEDLTAVTITVTRSGNTSGASTVDYATSDDTANQLADYEMASGTLNFAAGETSKSFVILINQDSYLEGDEKINLLLSNATGATLGSQSTAKVTIKDDAVEDAVNPIDDPQNFAYQQYHDILNREPDTGGLNYWTNELKKCGTDAACISRRRSEVAAEFFIEQEFQLTGYFIYRFHKSAFGIQPSYLQFMHDRSMVTAGDNLDMSKLEASKLAYADQFVSRPEFVQKYPAIMSGDQFITALLATVQQSTGIDLSAQKQTLLADYQANGSRARILRQVVDAPALVQNQYNRAFVLAQYFGYIRREPDQQGYDFWLDVLDHKVPNSLSGYQYLVCSFVTSPEYQKRFGTLTTHSNAECDPK